MQSTACPSWPGTWLGSPPPPAKTRMGVSPVWTWLGTRPHLHLAGVPPSGPGCCTPLSTDRHLWKHYLPHPWDAVGNKLIINQLSLFQCSTSACWWLSWMAVRAKQNRNGCHTILFWCLSVADIKDSWQHDNSWKMITKVPPIQTRISSLLFSDIQFKNHSLNKV